MLAAAFTGAALFAVLLYWRADIGGAETYGSARFATVWRLFREKMFYDRGVRIGDWVRGLGLYFDGTHMLTLGATGSGKGVSAIVPNLLRHKRIFLIDPGGENTAIAAKAWRQAGLAFYCINPFATFDDAPYALPAHGFNPLDILDPGASSFAANARLLAEMLTPRSGGETGGAEYFKDAAERSKSALLIHIKTTEPSERQNLSTLYELVNTDAAGWNALLDAMRENPACEGLVQQEANVLSRIEEQAPEEFSAIFSTIQQDLSWLGDPIIRAKMRRSDVDFSVLKRRLQDSGPAKEGGVISVVLPLEYLDTHAAILRLALACAILTMQRAPLSRKKTLFLIDEAAALGKISRFPTWLATLRKYRVVIWSIWQNIGQIVQLYDKNWQGIIGNCGMMQVLGINDLETAQYTQKMLGQCTVTTVTQNGSGQCSFGQTARPLLTADELMRIKPDSQIVCVAGLPPILLRKARYWQIAALKGRFYANPFYDGKSERSALLATVSRLWARLYYALVCLMAPHPLVALTVTITCILGGLLWQISS